MSSKRAPAKRSYRSTLRDEQALGTRQRIRRAARVLFEDRGFEEATIADIAAQAGVSAATVYAVFGSKAAIVLELMDELEQIPGAQESGEQLLAETDPGKQLLLFVQWIRRFFESGAALLRASRAVASNPDVAAMVAAGNSRRREGTQMLVDGWATRGALRNGMPVAQAADTLWLLTSAEIYLLSIDTLGWSADEYEQWLSNTAATQLFGSSVR